MYEENYSIHTIPNAPSIFRMKLNIMAYNSIKGFS